MAINNSSGCIIKLSLKLEEQAQERATRLGELAKDQETVSDKRKQLSALRELINRHRKSPESGGDGDGFNAGEIREIEREAADAGIDLTAYLDPIKEAMIAENNKLPATRVAGEEWGQPRGGKIATDSGAMMDYDGDGVITQVDIDFEDYNRAQQGITPITRRNAKTFDDVPNDVRLHLELTNDEATTKKRTDNVDDMLTSIDDQRDIVGEDASALGFKMRKEFNFLSTNRQQAADILKIEKQTSDRVGLA